MNLRQNLVEIALAWQQRYGVAPAITSAVSELDAANLVGMRNDEYSDYMQDKTAVARGHDFIHEGVRYQIKAHRPSGKRGSKITNAGKARNYEWDVLIWIRYNVRYEIEEAWAWDRDEYIAAFDSKSRVSPEDMRQGRSVVET
ncbi:MAG: hypothetical protein V7746_20460 [Halioglobus sp.]